MKLERDLEAPLGRTIDASNHKQALRQAKILRLPARVDLHTLDSELANLLRTWLHKRWPLVPIPLIWRNGMETAELRIVDQEPARPVTTPTLWLTQLERRSVSRQLESKLWCLPMPVTASSFCSAVARCLGSHGEISDD
jgi:hypothetical protein